MYDRAAYPIMRQNHQWSKIKSLKLSNVRINKKILIISLKCDRMASNNNFVQC